MENEETKAVESKPEWVKPEVSEFDVNDTTLNTYAGSGGDLLYYS